MYEETSEQGSDQTPEDKYDSEHGHPCEEDVRANPTNQPEIGPRSFNVKG